MANDDKLYLGNTVTFVVDCEVTTSSASRCYLYVYKPNLTETVWTGTSASTTCIVYTTTSTDLSVKGLYKANAYIQDATSTTWNFTGKTFTFQVYDKYE